MSSAGRRILLLGWALAAAAGAGELGLRLTVPWRPGYYDAPRDPGPEVQHPYGIYTYDPLGFADLAPAPGDPRPVVAWVGDSVLYGLGCPQEGRVTEVLERLHPGVNQVNLGTPGFSPDDPARWGRMLDVAAQIGAQRSVWLVNLNDVPAPPGARPRWRRLPSPWLRRNSYLWSALDHSWVAVQASGSDTPAVELHPHRFTERFDRAAEAIREVTGRFGARGLPMRLVILPYEMQVSAEAARDYAASGVRWEPGFLEGSAQAALIARLPGLDVVDARPAFDEAPRGAYFVAGAGGQADWNHLTAAGHARLAGWLVSSGWAEAGGQSSSSGARATERAR